MNHLQQQPWSEQSDLPFVSIIIPVRNAPRQIQTCIEALLAQTYPDDRYEIIVVDNGSIDNTLQIIESYPVKMLQEKSIPSPYPARNTGIRQTRGEIIAFTDADCQTMSQWLEQGVQALQIAQADLAGGKVSFIHSPEKPPAEIVDSLYNLDNKNYIANQRVCATSNLFVRKHVFDMIGLFPDNVRSGGDVTWTRKATNRGFKIVYVPDAEVHKQARKLAPLLKKQYRVGRGLPRSWRERGYSAFQIGYPTIRGLFPPPLWYVLHKIRERGTSDMFQRLFAIWLVTWVYNASKSVGTIHVLAESLLHKSKQFLPAAQKSSQDIVGE